MKILLLNLYYPPDTSATAKMAETVVNALARENEVTILCGRPSYDPSERRSWRLFQTEKIASQESVRIVRVGSTDYPRFNMKKRVLNYLTYTALMIPRALFTTCDVVVAMTDPPFEGIVGAFVAALKGKPYFYNIRDMYPDMAVGGSIVPPGLLARVWETLHRWALRRATKVIVLGEDMRYRILAKGVRAERIEIVRDGTEIPGAESPKPQLDQEVIRKIRDGFRFVLLHAGNIGFYGAWKTLVAAAKKLSGEEIGLVFVGEGAQLEEVKGMADGAANVRFLPFFPGNKIPSVLAAGDAHLITVKRGLEGVVVPSKMYGIIAAGKPIVAVAPRETDAVALGEKDGYSLGADPDRPEELVHVIRKLVGDPARVERMGRAALAAAPAYDRVKELQKFVKIVTRTRPR
jgi:putative colanic acid biosynthesis glycosyltransferase WcaI